jgi:hypothetical protein
MDSKFEKLHDDEIIEYKEINDDDNEEVKYSPWRISHLYGG